MARVYNRTDCVCNFYLNHSMSRKANELLMELILISDSKLKVMLTPDDMQRYEIDCDTIDYDNTETRRAFWNILDEAKHKTGFDAASDRVFIQVYPSKEGGCEMYVTKLGIFCGEEPVSNPSEPKKNYSKRGSVSRPHKSVYRFENLEFLLAVCSRLSEMDYNGDSSAFTSLQGSQCYLVITERNPSGQYSGASIGEFAFIGEYGKMISSYGIHSYIKEHCKCICEDHAVGILSGLYR